MMNDDKNVEQIKLKFRERQTRQIYAIAASLFVVLLGAVLYKRPDILGAVSGQTLVGFQVICIAAFIVFTAMNWRCPSCNKYLGSNIHKQRCSSCGIRLH